MPPLVSFGAHKAAYRLLDNDVAHSAFLDSCTKVQKAGNAVGRYVLMPDHAHLFLRLGWDGNVGVAIRCLKSGITRALRTKGYADKIWQDGFFDHVLRKSEKYSEMWDYMRMNPVRAGLTTRPEDWPYQGEVTAFMW